MDSLLRHKVEKIVRIWKLGFVLDVVFIFVGAIIASIPGAILGILFSAPIGLYFSGKRSMFNISWGAALVAFFTMLAHPVLIAVILGIVVYLVAIILVPRKELL